MEDIVKRLREELIEKRRVYVPPTGRTKGYWRRDDRRKKIDLKTGENRKPAEPKKAPAKNPSKVGVGRSARTSAPTGPSEGSKKSTYANQGAKKGSKKPTKHKEQPEADKSKSDYEGKKAESRSAMDARMLQSQMHGATKSHEDRLVAPDVDSMSRYQDADGNWDPEREKLHRKILDHFLDGVPKSKNPTVTFMGGGPAAGKSSIEKYNPEAGIPNTEDREAVLVNADDIKLMLPEMKEMVIAGDMGAATFVHEESSYLSKMLLNEAVARGQDVLFDGTGDSGIESLTKKMRDLRAGDPPHRVVAQYVTVDTETALARNRERAKTPLFPESPNGRLVPDSVVADTHATISAIFPQALDMGLFDEVTLWDTNKKPGEAPTVIVSGRGSNYSIQDPEAWDRFLAKAKPVTKQAPMEPTITGGQHEGPAPEGTVPSMNEINTMCRFAAAGKEFADTGLPDAFSARYATYQQEMKTMKAQGMVPYCPND